MYRKLEFGSMEKLEDETASSTFSGTADEQAMQQPESPKPALAASSNDFSVPSPTPSSAAASLSLPTTTDKGVIETRDYYGLAETVGGNHSCIVVITNSSTTTELRDPVVYTKKGYTRIPPDAKIRPNSSSYCAFRKTSVVIKGTCGVMSYEYDQKNGKSKRFAVMWKIPYRVVNHEENQVAIKWMDVDLSDPIDSNMHTSKDLYKEMAKSEQVARGVAKNGKSLHIVNVEDEADLSATCSGSCKAIMKVDFCFK